MFTDLLKGAGALPATSPTGQDPRSEDDRSRPGLPHRCISGLDAGKRNGVGFTPDRTSATHTMEHDRESRLWRHRSLVVTFEDIVNKSANGLGVSKSGNSVAG